MAAYTGTKVYILKPPFRPSFFCGTATPCASPPPRPSHSFRIHHLVNRDDWHLLAHAMTSDFSVAWQFLSKRTIGFSLRIKLHATDGKVFLGRQILSLIYGENVAQIRQQLCIW
jgi:hypothetical protein